MPATTETHSRLEDLPDFLKISLYETASSPLEAASLLVLHIGAVDLLADAIRESGTQRVILGNCLGGDDLQHFDLLLSVAEARLGLDAGTITIIASAADSAKGVSRLFGFEGKSARLEGLTWSRNALAADLSCDPQSPTVELARMQLVIAARACGVAAYDSAGFLDDAACADFIVKSRYLGFDGMTFAVQASGRAGRMISNTSLASE
jgi:citrate lyase beta subunit